MKSMQIVDHSFQFPVCTAAASPPPFRLGEPALCRSKRCSRDSTARDWDWDWDSRFRAETSKFESRDVSRPRLENYISGRSQPLDALFSWCLATKGLYFLFSCVYVFIIYGDTILGFSVLRVFCMLVRYQCKCLCVERDVKLYSLTSCFQSGQCSLCCPEGFRFDRNVNLSDMPKIISASTGY